jgi:hypothetical protein
MSVKMQFVNKYEARWQLAALFDKIGPDFTMVLDGTAVKFESYKLAIFKALSDAKEPSEKEEIALVSLLVLKEKWVAFKDGCMRFRMGIDS